MPKGLAKPEDDADYEFDEKFKTVSPRESAIEKVERALGIENLYDPRNAQLVNHLIQALKAESLYQRDVDYVVIDGEVKIVDEFTGRIMEGRRWSEGLHQAVEAKEGVPIKEEHVTLATITLQNYFRLYEKLAGMTGTAKTEEKEFQEIYDLVGRRDPDERARRPRRRERLHLQDEGGQVRRGHRRHRASVTSGGSRCSSGRSRSRSPSTSRSCSTRQGIPHNVLNAKQHEREAEIIKDAGEPGAVTIATNMAGRGVDIKLGEGVREVGGLYVLGTERHEARRIDNQLRGRSGRQGDPGESRFYLSAQDDLVRLFAGDRIYKIIDRFKLPDDQPMEAGILTKQIESAQKKVEEQNFVTRKNVLKYDDVMNTQREVIYEQRRAGARGPRPVGATSTAGSTRSSSASCSTTPRAIRAEWDIDALFREMRSLYDCEIEPDELDLDRMTREDLVAEFQDDARDAYEAKEEESARRPRACADAGDRALSRAPGRRRPLARAPRGDGVPPRRHPPPRHGPEGSRSSSTATRVTRCSRSSA